MEEKRLELEAEQFALVPYTEGDIKEIEIVDRMKEAYLMRVDDILKENRVLDEKAR